MEVKVKYDLVMFGKCASKLDSGYQSSQSKVYSHLVPIIALQLGRVVCMCMAESTILILEH